MLPVGWSLDVDIERQVHDIFAKGGGIVSS